GWRSSTVARSSRPLSTPASSSTSWCSERGEATRGPHGGGPLPPRVRRVHVLRAGWVLRLARQVPAAQRPLHEGRRNLLHRAGGGGLPLQAPAQLARAAFGVRDARVRDPRGQPSGRRRQGCERLHGLVRLLRPRIGRRGPRRDHDRGLARAARTRAGAGGIRAAVRVFIAGASGAIGRPLVRRLREAGHDVVGMTRSEEHAAALRAQGAEPVVGGGNGAFPFIHVEDAASATVAAIERGEPGVYNVVDDEPAPSHDWIPYVAELVAAPKPRRVPAWLARLFAGGLASMATQLQP